MYLFHGGVFCFLSSFRSFIQALCCCRCLWWYIVIVSVAAPVVFLPWSNRREKKWFYELDKVPSVPPDIYSFKYLKPDFVIGKRVPHSDIVDCWLLIVVVVDGDESSFKSAEPKPKQRKDQSHEDKTHTFNNKLPDSFQAKILHKKQIQIHKKKTHFFFCSVFHYCYKVIDNR